MIHLVDLSQWNTVVRYSELARAVSGAWIKATDAKRDATGRWMPFVDALHETHTNGLRAEGKATGSYAFAHPTQDPAEFVDFFLQHAWFDQLRLVVDYESLNADKTVPANAGPHCKAVVDRIASHSGTRAIIYASTSYALAMLRQCPALAAEDWWAAAYPGRTDPPEYMPTIPGLPPGRVVAWQWTGSSSLPGVVGPVDRDVAPSMEPLYVPSPDRPAA